MPLGPGSWDELALAVIVEAIKQNVALLDVNFQAVRVDCLSLS
jgi:hypothetical protein